MKKITFGWLRSSGLFLVEFFTGFSAKAKNEADFAPEFLWEIAKEIKKAA